MLQSIEENDKDHHHTSDDSFGDPKEEQSEDAAEVPEEVVEVDDSPEQDKEPVEDKVVANGKKDSMLMHWIILFDKHKNTYYSYDITKKYSEKTPDFVSLRKTLVDLKVNSELNEIFRTTNSEIDDWTSVYSKGGLYVSGLFGRNVGISERIELLQVAAV